MKLMDPVRQVLRVKHYSPRTEKTYVQWIEEPGVRGHKGICPRLALPDKSDAADKK